MKIGIKLEREDGWPPFDVEHLWVEKKRKNYEIRNCPFFVKDMSIGDIIDADIDKDGYAKRWKIIKRSKNTNLWIFTKITELLDALVGLGCSCEGGSVSNLYSVNVPESVSIELVDKILSPYEESGAAEVVVSSMRH